MAVFAKLASECQEGLNIASTPNYLDDDVQADGVLTLFAVHRLGRRPVSFDVGALAILKFGQRAVEIGVEVDGNSAIICSSINTWSLGAGYCG